MNILSISLSPPFFETLLQSHTSFGIHWFFIQLLSNLGWFSLLICLYLMKVHLHYQIKLNQFDFHYVFRCMICFTIEWLEIFIHGLVRGITVLWKLRKTMFYLKLKCSYCTYFIYFWYKVFFYEIKNIRHAKEILASMKKS